MVSAAPMARAYFATALREELQFLISAARSGSICSSWIIPSDK